MKKYTFLTLIFPLLFLLITCKGIPYAEIEPTVTRDHVATIVVTEATERPALLSPTTTSTTTLRPTATKIPTDTSIGTMTPTTTQTTLAPIRDLGKLAYIEGGDVRVKTLPGGESRRLITGGQNTSPQWSPSGQWLAFRKEQQVWLVRADSSTAQPLDEGAAVDFFAWAPTTDRLAYSTRSGELRISSPGDPVPVTLVPQTVPERGPGRVARVAWGPHETWLVYGWLQQSQADQTLTYHGLWKVSVDGQQGVELYNSGIPEKGVALLAGWSPTGERILFWQGDILSASLLADGAPLYSLSSEKGLGDTNTPVRLGSELMLLYPDFLAPAPPDSSWSADDVVALVVGSGRESWTNKGIEVANRRLTPETVVATSPAWSPNGQHMAYVALPDSGNLLEGGALAIHQALMQRRIWITDILGESQPRQLTDDVGYRDERPLDHKVTIPGYMITKEEEGEIGYTTASPLNDITHPARPKTEYKSLPVKKEIIIEKKLDEQKEGINNVKKTQKEPVKKDDKKEETEEKQIEKEKIKEEPVKKDDKKEQPKKTEEDK